MVLELLHETVRSKQICPQYASDACSCLLTKPTGTPPVRSPMKVLSLPLLDLCSSFPSFQNAKGCMIWKNQSEVLKSEGLKCCSLPKSQLPGFGIHDFKRSFEEHWRSVVAVKQEAGFWQGFEQVREWQASFSSVATSQELKMQGTCLLPIVDEWLYDFVDIGLSNTCRNAWSCNIQNQLENWGWSGIKFEHTNYQ